MIRVLHLLPRVPPAVCGIGDYAWLLAQALRDTHGIHSSFLSAGTDWTKPEGDTEFPVFRLPELTAKALVEFVVARKHEFLAVVLHMSPYGYQKRAVPLWLASGWQQLLQMPGRPRLITMFHELYASGSMRSSAYWLQPLQKWVLHTVARASDGLRTNRQTYAEWLERKLGLKNGVVTVMPVFSNLGEPEVLPSWEDREAAMVLFVPNIQSGESLEVVIRASLSLCRRFDLKRLHLIGCQQSFDRLGLGIEIVNHGFLNAEALSHLLRSCRMAYTAYSPLHLGKSGLFAAFAAHGLAVITQGRTNELPDGLQDGVNVLNESSLLMAETPHGEQIEKIGVALRQWYDRHSLEQNAQSYASQIKRLVSSSVSPCP